MRGELAAILLKVIAFSITFYITCIAAGIFIHLGWNMVS